MKINVPIEMLLQVNLCQVFVTLQKKEVDINKEFLYHLPSFITSLDHSSFESVDFGYTWTSFLGPTVIL